MNGILIINKPQNFTSQDVVNKVKKILNIKKAGHTGTLDPLATGVLPILLGDYTKISKYLIQHNKTYIATLKLGQKSETGDLEGNIIEEKNIPEEALNSNYVKEILKEFIGESMQKPPMYSAVKVNGKKLYEYARKGETVEVLPRLIYIESINLIKIENNEITFEVSCSKGTYIRVLCENIAEKLNTVGLMSSLIRTKLNNFDIENAITLEELEINKDNLDFFNSNLIKMENVFSDFERINLNTRKTELFLNGVMLTYEMPDGTYNIYNDEKYIGLGIVKNKLLKRDVVIHESFTQKDKII